MLKTFRLQSFVRSELKIVIVNREDPEAVYTGSVEIVLPSGSHQGEIVIRTQNLPISYKREIVTWFGIADYAELGVAGLRFHDLENFPGKVSYPQGEDKTTMVLITPDDFGKMTDGLAEKLIASETFNDCFSVCFDALVGYLDVDEVIEPESIRYLFRELGENLDVDSLDVSIGAFVRADWETREKFRASTSDNSKQYEQLGILSVGDDNITLGLTYGAEGYELYLEGLEDTENKNPALLSLCEEYEITL